METTGAQVTSTGNGFIPKANRQRPDHQKSGKDGRVFKKKPSPQERREESESTAPRFKIHATGFVSIHHNARRDGYVLRGLYVPGMVKETERFPQHLRNRIIVLANSVPGWVTSLCKQMADSEEPFLLRVNVTRLVNENLGIAYPCAKSEAQARAEWKRHQSQLMEKPKTIQDCDDYWAAACFVHERVARDRKLTIVKHPDVDSIRPHRSIAVSESGVFFTIQGGDGVFNFAHGIMNGVTTMQQEIGRAVKVNRYYGDT